ncbi:MAG: hypothetical protein ABIK65_05920 [Candidatus Eisenbacteria bacterium]
MKNRFNWIFELLRSAFFNAHSLYSRGVDPVADRGILFESIRAAVARARNGQHEFPGEPQYELFLDDYVAALEQFLREAADAEDLEPLLQDARLRITALEDDIRLHLK